MATVTLSPAQQAQSSSSTTTSKMTMADLSTAGPALHTTTTTTSITGPKAAATDDLHGHVLGTNDVPSQADVDKAGDLPILSADGASRPFKSLFAGGKEPAGSGGPRRALVIFIRHFFCGNCQEYIRALTAALPPPSALLALPRPTTITIIGCGDPTLIPMYAAATNSCPYAIYADPTRRVFDALGMIRTLSLGQRKPAYMTKWMLVSGVESVVQALRSGNPLKGGDAKQVGGEFLFEVVQRGGRGGGGVGSGAEKAVLEESGADDGDERVRVVWCSRMRNTRDHVEVDVLRGVLGLEKEGGENEPGPRAEIERREDAEREPSNERMEGDKEGDKDNVAEDGKRKSKRWSFVGR